MTGKCSKKLSGEQKAWIDRFVKYKHQGGEKGYMMQLNFEWDEEKERINLEKHGISFETAAYVFSDENDIEMYDFEHSIDEER